MNASLNFLILAYNVDVNVSLFLVPKPVVEEWVSCPFHDFQIKVWKVLLFVCAAPK